MLEITESVLVAELPIARQALSALRDLGVRIALDDFGTGHSSLQSLRELPVDIIKVAKPFIDGAARTAHDRALMRMMIDLGELFGIRVVAEGIEREDQLAALRELGCEMGQGYLLGRPTEPAAHSRALAGNVGQLALEHVEAAPRDARAELQQQRREVGVDRQRVLRGGADHQRDRGHAGERRVAVAVEEHLQQAGVGGLVGGGGDDEEVRRRRPRRGRSGRRRSRARRGRRGRCRRRSSSASASRRAIAAPWVREPGRGLPTTATTLMAPASRPASASCSRCSALSRRSGAGAARRPPRARPSRSSGCSSVAPCTAPSRGRW